VVIYDADEKVNHQRMKLGDETHTVRELPFITDKLALSYCHLRGPEGADDTSSSIRLYGFRSGKDVFDAPTSNTSGSEANADVDRTLKGVEKFIDINEIEGPDANGKYWHMGREVFPDFDTN
jgi:hypothetical protein